MKLIAGGHQIELQDGDYQAALVTVGAGIAALRHQNRNLVVPHPTNELPRGYMGKTLLPWPNRIVGGKYKYLGIAHELPINEHNTGSALHGLACWQEWKTIRASKNSVTFQTFTAPQYGYPFALVSTVTYTLDAETGLAVQIITRNVGTTTAPYGVSSHPYLTCDLRQVDDCALQIPAASVLRFEREQVPVAAAGFDFQAKRVVGTAEIDHAFTDLPSGPWNVDLTADEMTVRLVSDTPWVQIYTGASIRRIGMAVEPMTCPPNAFNTHQDLIELKPGAETVFEYSILEI